MPRNNYIRKQVNDSIHGLLSTSLGIGTSEDKLTSFDNFSFSSLTPTAARRLYANSDIMQNIVDIPAFDATREGFTLKSEYDDQDASKIMMDRLEELNIKDLFREYLEAYSIYSRGVLFYPILKEGIKTDLNQRLSINNIERVEGINVITEDDFNFQFNTYDPFSVSYLKPEYTAIRGINVHPSRFRWAVYKFFPRDNTGVSMLEKVLLACLALRVTNWSLASIMVEIQNKVLKVENLDSYVNQNVSPDFKEQGVTKRSSLIDMAKQWLTSSKMMVIDKDDSYERQIYSATGVKEATDFFFEYLSSVSNRPQAVIKGQAMGTISSADVDQRRYAERVRSHEQKRVLEPVLKYVIQILKNEQSSEFYKVLGSASEDIEFEIEWNQIWQPDANEESQIKLRNSQRSQIDISTGVRAPDQVRRELYPELKDEPLPEIPEDIEEFKIPENIKQQIGE